MGKSKSQSWTWHFDQPVDAVWPIMSDTARFNEAAKLPRHQIEDTPQPDGSVVHVGRAKKGPFKLEWREKPVSWVFGRWFEHSRYFTRGPIAFLSARVEIAPEGQGCRIDYRVEAAPANWLGRLILATGFFPSIGRNFGKLAKEAAEFTAGGRDTPFEYDPPVIGAEVERRVERLVSDIEATPHGHGLARRLADHVLKSQEVDLWHIRPLALARDWKVEPLDAIEACLQSVKAGLLELRWDLLCPRCRVAKAWVGSLDRLPRGAHCPTCNVDYDADFSKNVEAGFRPAPAIRRLESGEFCLFGPMTTPHIRVQVEVEAGLSRRLPAAFAPGPYRLRCLDPGPVWEIDHAGGGFPAVILGEDQIDAGPIQGEGEVLLENRSGRDRVVIVEDRSWTKDCLTADRVTSLQAFRDLFSGDVLRPGDEVAIGQVTLMFSDLKGSTALYERIGDATAYRLVRDHFAFLAEQVRGHEGAIVKTIGDAVMAAFADPADAVKAALAIQQEVAAFNALHRGDMAEPGVVIKLGLHKGPCIAVTLNERLDYFGGTVNMAARLQGRSSGGDVVLSGTLMAEPEVRQLLASYSLVEESAVIKGFDRPVPYFRLAAAG